VRSEHEQQVNCLNGEVVVVVMTIM